MAEPSKFPQEVRARAVALYRESPGRTIADVARELVLGTETFRKWVRQDEADRGQRHDRVTSQSTARRWCWARACSCGYVVAWCEPRSRLGQWCAVTSGVRAHCRVGLLPPEPPGIGGGFNLPDLVADPRSIVVLSEQVRQQAVTGSSQAGHSPPMPSFLQTPLLRLSCTAAMTAVASVCVFSSVVIGVLSGGLQSDP